MRRGFTLLEIVLAVLVSSMVLSACLALFRVLDRSNNALGERAQQFLGVGAAQEAMQNAFTSLLMMSGGGNPQAEVGRPRLLLSDPRASGVSGIPRLEVVVTKPPLPGLAPFVFEEDLERDEVRSGNRASRRGDRERIRREGERYWDGRPIRGAFELRQEPSGLWSLVWRNLAVGGEPLRDVPEQTTTLIEGLRSLEWLVFDDRRKQRNYSASRTADIPAYAECRLQTTAGHTALWLFEVVWQQGEEDRDANLADIESLETLFDEIERYSRVNGGLGTDALTREEEQGAADLPDDVVELLEPPEPEPEP
ncbi:MAG: prepilin-type N-terminal cleavage/methylation domain-containing protein [Planctomycetota bacterium]